MTQTKVQHPDVTSYYVNEDTSAYRDADARTVVRQIGRNIYAISGGRVYDTGHGVILPVSNGFKVVVDLMANDEYRVRRLFMRGAKVFLHGERTGVYAEDLAEVAYYASCFRSYDANEWPFK